MARTIAELNYYEILNVDRDATIEVIRKSYRRLMQRHGNHPDLGGDTATAAMINKAYSVLSDPERKGEYDARIDILRQVARGFVDAARACVFCELPHELGATDDADDRCGNCGSPLNVAKHVRIELSDQRAIARIRKNLSVIFFTHWPQSRGYAGRTEDISLSGLRLVTKYGLREGQRIKLLSSVVEAVGNITYCIPRRDGWRTEYLTGVSFMTLRFTRAAGGFLSQRV